MSRFTQALRRPLLRGQTETVKLISRKSTKVLTNQHRRFRPLFTRVAR